MAATRRRIDAYYSATKPDSKLHLEISCEGMKWLPVFPPAKSTLKRKSYSSLRTLGEDTDRRPCRMCALEQVLDAALRPRRREALVFATFTSQPAYVADERRFVEKVTSDSGAARLHRIADRLDAPTTQTLVGPATWGFFPRAGVRILERNLRTRVLPEVTEMSSAEQIQIFWTFVADSPVELGAVEAVDPWETASLLLQ